MKHRILLFALCAGLLLAPFSASAVTIDWQTVGNAGNDNDPATSHQFGRVNYIYGIGTTEVTNAQYAEFLNAKAASDPLTLYVTGSPGITRNGVSGSFSYAVKPNMGNKPVTGVTWYDAVRFANWMNNGQGNSDTETGSYTLLGGTPAPSNGSSVARNAGAAVFLTNENEWYKAAYYDPTLNSGAGGYWLYPTRSNSTPTMATATSVGDISNPGANVANYNLGADWNGQDGNVTTVGSAGPLSASFYGTFDQGGNAREWVEDHLSSNRALRGGGYIEGAQIMRSTVRSDAPPTLELVFGFRLAMIPEPSSLTLAALALAGLAAWRLRRRNRNA